MKTFTVVSSFFARLLTERQSYLAFWLSGLVAASLVISVAHAEKNDLTFLNRENHVSAGRGSRSNVYSHSFSVTREGAEAISEKISGLLKTNGAPDEKWLNSTRTGIWMKPSNAGSLGNHLSYRKAAEDSFYGLGAAVYLIKLRPDFDWYHPFAKGNRKVWEAWLQKHGHEPNAFSATLAKSLRQDELPWHSGFFEANKLAGWVDFKGYVFLDSNAILEARIFDLNVNHHFVRCAAEFTGH